MPGCPSASRAGKSSSDEARGKHSTALLPFASSTAYLLYVNLTARGPPAPALLKFFCFTKPSNGGYVSSTSPPRSAWAHRSPSCAVFCLISVHPETRPKAQAGSDLPPFCKGGQGGLKEVCTRFIREIPLSPLFQRGTWGSNHPTCFRVSAWTLIMVELPDSESGTPLTNLKASGATCRLRWHTVDGRGYR